MGTIHNGYYFLAKGEIIQEGDEVDGSVGFNDPAKWELAKTCIGQPAPDPRFPAHRIYRRKLQPIQDIATGYIRDRTGSLSDMQLFLVMADESGEPVFFPISQGLSGPGLPIDRVQLVYVPRRHTRDITRRLLSDIKGVTSTPQAPEAGV